MAGVARARRTRQHGRRKTDKPAVAFLPTYIAIAVTAVLLFGVFSYSWENRDRAEVAIEAQIDSCIRANQVRVELNDVVRSLRLMVNAALESPTVSPRFRRVASVQVRRLGMVPLVACERVTRADIAGE